MGARLAADLYEERGRRDLLGLVVQPIVQGEGVEVIGSVAVGDLGVQAHRDIGGGLDLPDQVVRHRARQVAPRTSIVSCRAYCARYSAAWPAEFPAPTTKTSRPCIACASLPAEP